MADQRVREILRDFIDECDSGFEAVTDDVQANDCELLNIFDESETSDVEVIEIDDEIPSAPRPTKAFRPSHTHNKDLGSPGLELPYLAKTSVQLNARTCIRVGDTVELEDTAERKEDQLHSSDFLRVKKIVHNLLTDEITLRGYRLRRARYYGQIFNRNLNELVMILPVADDDPRSAFIQGMEEVSVEDVTGTRDCVLTSKPFPHGSFRKGPPLMLPRDTTQDEAKQLIFHTGRLVCRYVHVRVMEPTGKSYKGEVRGLYARESDSDTSPAPPGEGSSSQTPICLDIDDREDLEKGPGFVNKSPKQRTGFPMEAYRYTFGDVYCGAGGASQGALQAGLVVIFGIDNDHAAIQAYAFNHTKAEPCILNAHDFVFADLPKVFLSVDILHLSPPCKFWSSAHTREGKNDQANYETIYTVGPILAKVKPRIVTLEQTYGLMTNKQHSRNFRLLLNDIYNAGYNVRYKIQDLSEFGLPQRRKRLLIIGARRAAKDNMWCGTPIPPFPKPTHGPAGSGLKRYVSVADALKPLERVHPRDLLNDKYHQPDSMDILSQAPYNPDNTFLKGCITTSGGENYHYSGRRRYTVRELSLLQGFKYGYHFTGSPNKANEQNGNAFPPIMAEAMYRSCAQTLEAFDNGLIDTETHLDDLEYLLAPSRTSASAQANTREPRYRYLNRSANSNVAPSGSGTPSKKPALFSNNSDIEPRPQVEKEKKKKRKRKISFFDLTDSSDGDSAGSSPGAKNNNALTEEEKRAIAEQNGDVIELD
ncbi:S-adenosyl-L-methionine-dependent methyltransferase [Pleomassaria siparia CBS 279.74]|uniref:DNA (cytosine-5-)-methyltransferase n=1 Tax=Pleomassaria siparia CBS 279.74 TaxID=1314801 RepID=A0A6G1KIF4_9PLEO|nr:S-adenosyl-L-methionine-dependent methyltransferase [Pleomassaria siparia CBS 279.74]